MVKAMSQDNPEGEQVPYGTGKEVYQCEKCGFKYAEKEWAQKCEAWCKEKGSCNNEIVQHAIRES